jgi:hypothetical protein
MGVGVEKMELSKLRIMLIYSQLPQLSQPSQPSQLHQRFLICKPKSYRIRCKVQFVSEHVPGSVAAVEFDGAEAKFTDV